MSVDNHLIVGAFLFQGLLRDNDEGWPGLHDNHWASTKIQDNYLRQMERPKRTENQFIREIAYIMLRNKGPFTRKMLAGELALIHPDVDIRSLLNEVSYALLLDKSCNERFKVVEGRKYDLKEKPQH